MALPKIDVPTYSLTLPSSGKQIRFRPFLVKEEKILLMAGESDDPADMVEALKQVINNCAVADIDIEKMPTIDIEYFFVQLRSKSVGDKVRILASHKDSECKYQMPVNINLEHVEVVKDENHTNKIDLGNDIGLTLKYPDFAMVQELEKISGNDIDKFFELVTDSIENIWDAENVYEASEHSEEELKEFLETLNNSAFEKIQQFYTGLPALVYKTRYKCKECGEYEDLELRGLANFFV